MRRHANPASRRATGDRAGHYRRARLAEAFRTEISEIVRFELSDERVDTVAVHHVALNAAGTAARVYVSGDGNPDIDFASTVRALNEAMDFIRGSLGQRLGLHRVPMLHFVFDKALLSAARIEAILDEERVRFAELEQPPQTASEVVDETSP
ncbi:MAG: 30S ribosome-binding factor RbfA [Chloracidobacterium sp.]|uniref:Ribosome-binding factor A n=1 Tax=Chloracidobacterium validum TaxID=2821543 RepID=A0ABX8B6D5_9BACT|nr:30S ribosome-binding factor RbfA [Chloracidobacterium validum]QUW01997.1 30S ribosome-binding factor RbfA [Chloracidobacterium validum]